MRPTSLPPWDITSAVGYHFRREFGLSCREFGLYCCEFVGFCREFGLSCREFVGFCREFVCLAVSSLVSAVSSCFAVTPIEWYDITTTISTTITKTT